MHLSPGQVGDGVEGRTLLENWHEKLRGLPDNLAMVMDKAYEGDETRASVALAGFIPVVPPKTNRRKPWEYTAIFTKGAIILNDCSESSRDFDVSARGSKNSGTMFMAFLFIAFIWLII